MNPALSANRLLENAHALGRLTTPAQRVLVGNPDLGQEAGRVQFGENGRVDLVRLHPGIGDCANQARIGDDHALHVRPHQALDGSTVARRLDHDLIVRVEGFRKPDDPLVHELDSQFFDDTAVFQNRHLSKRPMDVHADNPHVLLLSCFGSQRACTTSTDPRSRRNRASRRGGHVTTRARGSW